jgi:ribosomal protein S2
MEHRVVTITFDTSSKNRKEKLLRFALRLKSTAVSQRLLPGRLGNDGQIFLIGQVSLDGSDSISFFIFHGLRCPTTASIEFL